MQYIKRKSLLYKTEVEYGDYTINHVEGCSHGCRYPCYAMMMSKRFGRVKTYEEWIQPKIVENAIDLLEKEIPKLKNKIHSVHLSFTTDPFMYGQEEISSLSLELIKRLNDNEIKCTVLTKGLLPEQLEKLSKDNELGISLVSLNEEFREKYEPNSATYEVRISNLYKLHKMGLKTWVSIEPYPTPNIIEQDIHKILNNIKFVDKIVFGRLNYNSVVSQYKNYKKFYNETSEQVLSFCQDENIECYIKKGTAT